MITHRTDGTEGSAEPVDPTTRQRRWSDGAAASQPAGQGGPWAMATQWPSLVATLSEQAVESSNTVMRGLDFLVGAGRLRHSEAKALGETLQRLRDVSLRAQQITRLASGRIRQARDRVELASMIQGLLSERAKEFHGINASVRCMLEPADVLLDPSVAATLVGNIIDWALVFSRDIEFSLASPVWPAPARLVVRVKTPAPAAPAPVTSAAPPAAAAASMRPASAAGARERGRRMNDGLHWILLRQMAASAGLGVVRSGGDGVAVLTVEFPKTFKLADGLSSVDLFAPSGHAAQGMEDVWVLVIVRDVALRGQAVDALRLAGIDSKAAASLDEARVIALRTRPNAVVLAFDTHDGFEMPRADALGCGDDCPIVEIVSESPSFNTLGFSGWEIAKVGRDDLDKELAPTVLFELAKQV